VGGCKTREENDNYLLFFRALSGWEDGWKMEVEWMEMDRGLIQRRTKINNQHISIFLYLTHIISSPSITAIITTIHSA
jgi:hypothetical protein